jgi:hypothetical protein
MRSTHTHTLSLSLSRTLPTLCYCFLPLISVLLVLSLCGVLDSVLLWGVFLFYFFLFSCCEFRHVGTLLGGNSVDPVGECGRQVYGMRPCAVSEHALGHDTCMASLYLAVSCTVSPHPGSVCISCGRCTKSKSPCILPAMHPIVRGRSPNATVNS